MRALVAVIGLFRMGRGLVGRFAYWTLVFIHPVLSGDRLVIPDLMTE